MGKTHKRLSIILLIVALAGVACSPSVTLTPTELPLSASPTSRLNTHEGPVVRATLPPTWTETPTPTATDTFTPTPVTPTATPTAVPNLEALCDSFTASASFPDGHAFRLDGTITMLFGTALTAVADPDTGTPIPITVRWLATHRQSGDNLGVELGGGEIFEMELPISRLPYPGYYDWTAAVYGEGIDAQCRHDGHFFVSPIPRTPEATVEATPEATIETTSEATAVQ